MKIKINLNNDFDGLPGPDHHECESFREGDWIIFGCPQCADYERRLNWRTGEMNIKNNKSHINHSGSYFPTEFADAFLNTN